MKNNYLVVKYILLCCMIAILSNCVTLSNVKAEEANSYFQESLEELNNPERGFYEPIGYEMKVSGNQILDLKYNLIHLRVGISAFSKAANGNEDLLFTQDMLDALDGTLKNVKKNGGSVIIRFAYDDFDGTKNLEPSMDMMLMHINQLESVFEQNKDVIAYVELGLFGPWGEMHSSEMCTTDNVSVALDAMLKAVPEDITIGVRTPAYYAAWAKVERKNLHNDITQKGTDAYRVGLYNDGYLGSESDLGTFSNREIETTWLSNQARHTFYGGEVVANRAEGEPLNTVAYMSEEAFKTHTTYLNLYWNDSVIDSWKEEIYQGEDVRYQGQTGYTYVVNHLGYRYVLRQCQTDSQVRQGESFQLDMKVENVGFANIINAKKVSVILEGNDKTYEIITDIDVRNWNSKELTEIKKSIVLPDDIATGEYKVYFRISKYGDYTSDNNYQCIQFANEGIWKESIGANQIGSICVLERQESEVTPEEPSTQENPTKPEEPATTEEPTKPAETPEKGQGSGDADEIAPGKVVSLKQKKTYSTSSVQISWKKVADATKYEVYVATGKNGSYKLVATTAQTSYKNTGLNAGKTYYYKVRAYKEENDKKVYGEYSKAVKAITKTKKVTIKAKRTGTGKVKVTWKKVTGADGYEVYRKTGANGKYKKVKPLSGKVSYTASKLKSGKKYYFKVRAYRKVGKTKVYSAWSNVKKTTVK